jgi:hypothetical protein
MWSVRSLTSCRISAGFSEFEADARMAWYQASAIALAR